jgi:hypothetical protein
VGVEAGAADVAVGAVAVDVPVDASGLRLGVGLERGVDIGNDGERENGVEKNKSLVVVVGEREVGGVGEIPLSPPCF